MSVREIDSLGGLGANGSNTHNALPRDTGVGTSAAASRSGAGVLTVGAVGSAGGTVGEPEGGAADSVELPPDPPHAARASASVMHGMKAIRRMKCQRERRVMVQVRAVRAPP